MSKQEESMVNATEKAAQSLSEVNPNSKIKALKDKGTLAVVLITLTVIVIFMNKGKSKTVQQDSAKQYTSIERDNVLKDNLERIKKLKRQAKERPANTVSAKFEDGSKVVGLSPVKPVAQEVVKKPVIIRPVRQAPRMTKEVLARMNAPTTFLNSGSTAQVHTSERSTGKGSTVIAGTGANAEFIKHQGSVASITATKIANPDLTLPAGELIPATMNVAQNSELPGIITAVTERDIYSLTGSNVLVPRGSRLLGQYNSGVVQGQNRFLVVWNRVQLPNGVIATLNSPGTDSLGRSGLNADSVDRHFIERFGTATLISILGAATANVGVDSETQFNSAAQYRSAIAESLNKTATQTLERDMQIKPTLHKYQGAEVNVFVAHDIDFSVVGSQEITHVAIKAQREVWK